MQKYNNILIKISHVRSESSIVNCGTPTLPLLGQLLVIALFLTLTTGVARALVSITTDGQNYTENFDSYAGTLESVPTHWTVSSIRFRGIGTGTNNTGGAYGFDSGSEISCGALRSGTNPTVLISVSFINNTGGTITRLNISYDFEQYRYSNTSGLDVSETGIGADVSSLSHAGTPTGSNGTVTVTPKTLSLSGLNIVDGSTFSIFFQTNDRPGADNGVAVDNFSLTAWVGKTNLSATKSSAVVSDPVNSSSNPKRIPGAVIEHSIYVSNSGDASPDADSVYVTDVIDAASQAFDVSTGVSFIDGATSSTLNMGSITYSNVPAPGPYLYNYTPVPDIEGYDSNITSIKITTKGIFAWGGNPPPAFTLKYRTKIK